MPGASSRVHLLLAALIALLLAGCGPASAPAQPAASSRLPKVLATETFLADMARNVAGDRLPVDALVPGGVDPHSYEPAPGDVTRVADSTALIVNGAGLETFLERLLKNAGGERLVITASAGLTSRTAREGEADKGTGPAGESADPHFWLDPTKAIKYVENIRDGLSQADPAGAGVYEANARSYIRQLKDLDQWIADQVQKLPPDRRLLVTNHESLGYFADRYGFRVVGTVIPSTSSEAAPSAQELARLVDEVKAAAAPAIFLEAGTNPQLAEQAARETGARVVTDLYAHGLSGSKGPAPNYVAMMKHNTQVIVKALE